MKKFTPSAPQCSFCKKTVYGTLEAACASVEHIKQTVGLYKPYLRAMLSAYRCPHSKVYHIGHKRF